jgi:hypothetical protein
VDRPALDQLKVAGRHPCSAAICTEIIKKSKTNYFFFEKNNQINNVTGQVPRARESIPCQLAVQDPDNQFIVKIRICWYGVSMVKLVP